MSQTTPSVDLPQLLAQLEPTYAKIQWLEETGSTNADLAESALGGEALWPNLSLLMTNSQVAGTGRLGRSWDAPAGLSMIASVLLRPAAAVQKSGFPAFQDSGYGWLSIMAGVALCQSVKSATGVSAQLKWPNDVLSNGRKLAGILAQLIAVPLANGTRSAATSGNAATSADAIADERSWAGPAVVVGLGMNVSQVRDQLPVQQATSLLLEGASQLDRTVLLPAYLERFAQLYTEFLSVGGNAMVPVGTGPSLHAQASSLLVTLGLRVRAEMPDGSMVHGTAVSLASGGELLVEDAQSQTHQISAADVVHLRRDEDSGLSYA